MTIAINAKRKKRAAKLMSTQVEKDLSPNIARGRTYLNATHGQFVANIEKAKRYFEESPEGGVLAGPIARR